MAVLPNEGKPLIFQRFIHIQEVGCCMAVYVNFRICHQLLIFIICCYLAEKPVLVLV